MVSPLSIAPMRRGIYAIATIAALYISLLIPAITVLRAGFCPEYAPKTYAGSVGGGTMVEVNADFYGVFSPCMEVLHVPLYEIIVEEEDDVEEDVFEYSGEEEEEENDDDDNEEEDEDEEEPLKEEHYQGEGVEKGSLDETFSWSLQQLLYGMTCSSWVASLIVVIVISLHSLAAALIVFLGVLAVPVRLLCLLLMGSSLGKTKPSFRHRASKELRRKLSIPYGAVVWVGEVCMHMT